MSLDTLEVVELKISHSNSGSIKHPESDYVTISHDIRRYQCNIYVTFLTESYTFSNKRLGLSLFEIYKCI